MDVIKEELFGKWSGGSGTDSRRKAIISQPLARSPANRVRGLGRDGGIGPARPFLVDGFAAEAVERFAIPAVAGVCRGDRGRLFLPLSYAALRECLRIYI